MDQIGATRYLMLLKK